MGHRRSKRHRPAAKPHTLPSSPTHSSSSSSFEFTVPAASPRKSASSAAAADLCPADDLFYKGQLLPLHPSPRLSMVRTLLLSSASTSSSSDTATTTASRSSSSSSTDDPEPSSGRPSSVADDELKRLTTTTSANPIKKPSRYHFSLPKLFRKEQRNPAPPTSGGGAAAARRVSSSAREMIRRYMKKVKPLYEKLSQKQKTSAPLPTPPPAAATARTFRSELNTHASMLHSFSGNLRLYPRARSHVSSCPSSMRSSPSRSGSGFYQMGWAGPGTCNSDSSSMEELQNAIQGAIAHCKNSMIQNKNNIIIDR